MSDKNVKLKDNQFDYESVYEKIADQPIKNNVSVEKNNEQLANDLVNFDLIDKLHSSESDMVIQNLQRKNEERIVREEIVKINEIKNDLKLNSQDVMNMTNSQSSSVEIANSIGLNKKNMIENQEKYNLDLKNAQKAFGLSDEDLTQFSSGGIDEIIHLSKKGVGKDEIVAMQELQAQKIEKMKEELNFNIQDLSTMPEEELAKIKLTNEEIGGINHHLIQLDENQKEYAGKIERVKRSFSLTDENLLKCSPKQTNDLIYLSSNGVGEKEIKEFQKKQMEKIEEVKLKFNLTNQDLLGMSNEKLGKVNLSAQEIANVNSHLSNNNNDVAKLNPELNLNEILLKNQSKMLQSEHIMDKEELKHPAPQVDRFTPGF